MQRTLQPLASAHRDGPHPGGAAGPRVRRRSQRQWRRAPMAPAAWATAWALCIGAPAAHAHDSWLEQRATTAAGVELALTTGALFPLAETAIAASSLVERGCVDAQGARVALRAGAQKPEALVLHAALRRGQALAACWAETESFEVTVEDRLVPVYLREIGASAALRQAWAEQQARGLPWVERYTKHARITLAPVAGRESGPSTTGPAAIATNPLALDIELETPGPLRAGQTLRFRALRDGQPLAGLAVELRGDASSLGLWRRTAHDGRAEVPVPLAGRWVLRATELLPVPERPGHWQSRFVTHTFSVGDAGHGEGPAAVAAAAAVPGPQPKTPPSMPKARSTNHTSATAAINAEPPTNTARR